ncbi:MAG: type II toxin-antitoxin system VapC family toxin [Actinomycetota bacterium]|nr:type II toxin-antitoxin system VapC family toxin [Actinomycetota bacterium]
MKLLDTTVAIDHLRGADAARELLRQVVGAGLRIGASELVRFELLVGVRQTETTELEDFSATLVWFPVDTDVARLGAALARRYRPSYSAIEDIDYLIAATALLLDAELLTTNTRHFPMLEGLLPAY